MEIETMDDVTKEPTSIDLAVLEEETNELRKGIRRELRRQERRGLKTFGKVVGWTIGAAALFLGEIVGINYAVHNRTYTQYDGARIESRVEGWVNHTKLGHKRDGSRTLFVYTPFETVTSRSYTDENGDGQVDYVWRTRGHADPLRGSQGSVYFRADPAFNAEDEDGAFQEGLERFGEPLIVESR